MRGKEFSPASETIQCHRPFKEIMDLALVGAMGWS
jgi:hypothetical protein